jgi:hypothetical protein
MPTAKETAHATMLVKHQELKDAVVAVNSNYVEGATASRKEVAQAEVAARAAHRAAVNAFKAIP